MTNCFHLAIPAGNIKTALKFYCDILGCKTGNQEEGRWIDINFWGNELTLHETKSKQFRERHDVDMGAVCVPHFGVHLPWDIYSKVKKNKSTLGVEKFGCGPANDPNKHWCQFWKHTHTQKQLGTGKARSGGDGHVIKVRVFNKECFLLCIFTFKSYVWFIIKSYRCFYILLNF